MKIPVVPFGQSRSPRNEAEPSALHRQLIAGALERLGRTAKGEPEPVPDSVINHNFRVETDEGPLFVRIHRQTRHRQRLLLEQSAQRWAGERGIPVLQPLADAHGETCWGHGGRLYSVYPWVDGVTLKRGAIDTTGAAVLGDLHGRLHVALRDFDDPHLAASPQPHWNTEHAIAELSRIDDLIRYYPAPGEERLRAQRTLRIQLELLESGAARPAEEFAHFPLQPVHADFHERNVLFDSTASKVLAVVDWEMVSLMSPVTELMRAVDFMGLLDPVLLRAYLAAYARHNRIPRELAADAVEQWWQMRLNTTWAFRRVFIEGDDRAAEFFDNIGARLLKYRDPAARRPIADALLEFAS